MQNQNISFSVCLPTYNRAEFLPACIESVLAQTYPIFELIILDNNSSDETEKVVGQFTDKRIRYIKNDKNVGMYANHNLAIDFSQNDWVIFIHSDEILLPNALKVYDKEITKIHNKNCGFLFTSKDKTGICDFLNIHEQFKLQFSLLTVILGIGNVSGMCISKKALLEFGGFNEKSEMTYIADHELLAKVASKYKMNCIDEKILYVEEGSHQTTATLSKKFIYNNIVAFMNFVYRLPGFSFALSDFFNYYSKWDRSTISKMLFYTSTLKDKGPFWKLLMKGLTKPSNLLNRQTLYGLGNSIFGNKFYSSLKK